MRLPIVDSSKRLHICFTGFTFNLDIDFCGLGGCLELVSTLGIGLFFAILLDFLDFLERAGLLLDIIPLKGCARVILTAPQSGENCGKSSSLILDSRFKEA
jgi:hypothetical protein